MFPPRFKIILVWSELQSNILFIIGNVKMILDTVKYKRTAFGITEISID